VAIELQNVTFVYPGGVVANRDISLEIGDNERVAIVGQNGAGKTTCVKLMNALYKPVSGTVFINGVNTKKCTTAQIAKTVGYVFQNPDDQIFNNKVITELEYMPKYFKIPSEEIKRRVEEYTKLTQIEEYLEQNPYDIPFPIRKFITIAAILCAEPRYIILDEPTAGQDSRGIKILEDIIDFLGSKGVGVITITHDMEFVAANFRRVVVMAHANVIADSNARDIFWNESVIKEASICQPQITELARKLNMNEKILFYDEMVSLLA
jgi:energy-coupling factor transport system ATP-binding protein